MRQTPDALSFKLLPVCVPPGTEAYFQTWTCAQGSATLLAPPALPGDQLMGIMILPTEAASPSPAAAGRPAEWTWQRLGSDPAAHAACLRACFPDACGPGGEGVDAAAASLAAARPQLGGVTTVCGSLVAGPAAAALVGDAGHSCLASLGQGCNAALEGAAALAAAVAGAGDAAGVAAGLAAYGRAHKPNADAVGRLSLAGFGGGSRALTALFIARILLVRK